MGICINTRGSHFLIYFRAVRTWQRNPQASWKVRKGSSPRLGWQWQDFARIPGMCASVLASAFVILSKCRLWGKTMKNHLFSWTFQDDFWNGRKSAFYQCSKYYRYALLVGGTLIGRRGGYVPQARMVVFDVSLESPQCSCFSCWPKVPFSWPGRVPVGTNLICFLRHCSAG